MPIPLTWDEELISEWLQLNGYFIQSGLKVGRFGEADIVGIKKKEKTTEIWHIEAGSVGNTIEKDKEMVRKKSRQEVQKSISEQVGIDNYDYRYTYLAKYIQNKSIITDLKSEGYDLRDFDEWINQIITDVHHYMYHNRKNPRMLPNNLWLLKLLSWLIMNNKLSISKSTHELDDCTR